MSHSKGKKKYCGTIEKTWGETLPNPPRSCPFSETRSLGGWVVVGAAKGPWWEGCLCQGCRDPETQVGGAAVPPQEAGSLCQPQVLLYGFLSPTRSFWKPLRVANIKMAQENLWCLGHEFSLLNQVGDYYKKLCDWSPRTFGRHSTVPGKDIKTATLGL